MKQKNNNSLIFIALMLVSFIIIAMIYTGIVLKEDLVGRIIYGAIFILVGIGWIGLYFYKMKGINKLRKSPAGNN